jgi:hypothetical protein
MNITSPHLSHCKGNGPLSSPARGRGHLPNVLARKAGEEGDPLRRNGGGEGTTTQGATS